MKGLGGGEINAIKGGGFSWVNPVYSLFINGEPGVWLDTKSHSRWIADNWDYPFLFANGEPGVWLDTKSHDTGV